MIWTRNLPIWSRTRYRCATESCILLSKTTISTYNHNLRAKFAINLYHNQRSWTYLMILNLYIKLLWELFLRSKKSSNPYSHYVYMFTFRFLEWEREVLLLCLVYKFAYIFLLYVCFTHRSSGAVYMPHNSMLMYSCYNVIILGDSNTNYY